MAENIKQKKIIGSVVKAFHIIDYISEEEREQGATEISDALGYGVSATYHLLNTLKECNLITQNINTKKYQLSLKMWQLGMSAYRQNHISIALKPFLVDLKNKTGETSNLTVLDKNKIVYIAQEESDKLIKMFTQTGASAPLHCTAAGKIFLAYKSPEKRDEILKDYNLTYFTENTIIDKNQLLNELVKVSELGYGFDIEERDEDVSCVAAPIFGLHDEVIACLSISGPHNRFTNKNIKEWVNIITHTAKEATDFLRSSK
ncbi:MAG: IclR family transcriptional regulator [Gudongella sp.]|nr:IclR family transcriptional regulator [Gudongella sp.]